MHYLRSYRFLFNSPRWGTNLLLGSLCSLIPAVGPIVLIGYFFDIIDVLRRRRTRVLDEATGEEVMEALPVQRDIEESPYPDFEFNRFADYLSRGIWPFLIYFIFGLAIGFLMFFLSMICFFFTGILSGNSKSVWPFVIAGCSLSALSFFMQALVGIVTTPIYLRAGLSGDFAGAFSMAFFRDFLKRVGFQSVLAHLFLAFTGSFLIFGGLLLCYFGIFPAVTLYQFAHHHLVFQLYELYLERGGMPIERQEPRPAYRDIEYARRERSTDVMRPAEE